VDAPPYVASKTATAVAFSFAAGLIIASFAHVYVLRAFGVKPFMLVDVIITAIMIGAGSKPIHEVLNLLGGAANTLAGVATRTTQGRTTS